MSHPNVTDGAGDQPPEIDGEGVNAAAPESLPQHAVPQETARQPTGDRAVDEVLGQLDQVSDEPLDAQIEVGERVHQVLQGRLADLGKV